ncbi:hypothetical protein THAOC_26873 [Thalassiosira oceanica]|uniref:Uncharacterized protein n=1 Tax=Thalassiosira oceanica TaxID=159749 RepID=K0RKB3_THAOC|nr:hypothetical protein THAOC_26873 [Thalassiosira oceanica]|eukprot:EJK53645.1 hypothetical protein THAOC_26873 [Thalassiosira oceanica]
MRQSSPSARSTGGGWALRAWRALSSPSASGLTASRALAASPACSPSHRDLCIDLRARTARPATVTFEKIVSIDPSVTIPTRPRVPDNDETDRPGKYPVHLSWIRLATSGRNSNHIPLSAGQSAADIFCDGQRARRHCAEGDGAAARRIRPPLR